MSNRETAAARGIVDEAHAAVWREFYATVPDEPNLRAGVERGIVMTLNCLRAVLAASLPVLPETRERWEYDSEAHAGYVRVRDGKVAATRLVTHEVNFDLAADGSLLGVEILFPLPPAVSVVEPQPAEEEKP